MGITKLKALCLTLGVSADYLLGLPRDLEWPRQHPGGGYSNHPADKHRRRYRQSDSCQIISSQQKGGSQGRGFRLDTPDIADFDKLKSLRRFHFSAGAVWHQAFCKAQAADLTEPLPQSVDREGTKKWKFPTNYISRR